MSKVIKLTPEHIKECMTEFEKDLTSSKWADGKINFSKTIGTISRKAKIFFTEEAWMKMQALVREFEKEVAWHGVAFRGEDAEKDEYIIKDILVYPQKVTGASVEMDTEEYAKWIEENIEDERFFDIRMQGHSHVNMGVSPSSVDLTHQEAILDQLSDNLFYIFMIWNKKGDSNIKIYDLAKNVLFETADIDVEVMDDGYGLDSFIKEAKGQVKDRVYNAGYQYSYQYGGKTYTPVSSSSNTEKKEPEKKIITKQVRQSQRLGTGNAKARRKRINTRIIRSIMLVKNQTLR
jgi:hypothetical protein